MTSTALATLGMKVSDNDKAINVEFRKYMAELNRLLQFESATLFLVENETQTLKEIAHFGEGIDFINKVHFSMGCGLSAWVAQKGKRIYLADIHRGSRHGLNPIRSYLSMPLELNNKIIGVLNLGHLTPNAFDAVNLDPVEHMLKEIARKIYNITYLNYLSYRRDDSIGSAATVRVG